MILSLSLNLCTFVRILLVTVTFWLCSNTVYRCTSTQCCSLYVELVYLCMIVAVCLHAMCNFFVHPLPMRPTGNLQSVFSLRMVLLKKMYIFPYCIFTTSYRFFVDYTSLSCHNIFLYLLLVTSFGSLRP